MSFLLNFAPMILFVFLFLGSGIYFSAKGVQNAFYQISPLVAIIPPIILGWILRRESTKARTDAFLNGMRHPDIMTMCIIFLLAGAFSEITKAIGSMDSIVNLCLSLVSPRFLLIGIFIIASFISTSIGTSTGTVAALAPIALGVCTQTNTPSALGMATVVGGAMFGDNLSLISDSTIAAVLSQKANMKARFKLNAKIACLSGLVTIGMLVLMNSSASVETHANKAYSLWLITPYIVLIFMATSGINVFISLLGSIIFATFLGLVTVGDYTFLDLNASIIKGFLTMHEIIFLSLFIGGLSGLASKGPNMLVDKILSWISSWGGGKKMAQLCIAKVVILFDILLANNTIAIIFSGEIARKISKKYAIPPHYSASWLDIFSCVFQGIIPYGAQILLASAIADISPLSITPHVYYCYILGLVSLGYIVFKNIEKESMI